MLQPLWRTTWPFLLEFKICVLSLFQQFYFLVTTVHKCPMRYNLFIAGLMVITPNLKKMEYLRLWIAQITTKMNEPGLYTNSIFRKKVKRSVCKMKTCYVYTYKLIVT